MLNCSTNYVLNKKHSLLNFFVQSGQIDVKYKFVYNGDIFKHHLSEEAIKRSHNAERWSLVIIDKNFAVSVFLKFLSIKNIAEFGKLLIFADPKIIQNFEAGTKTDYLNSK